MTLYEVRIEHTTYVIAKDTQQATKIAESNIGSDIMSVGSDMATTTKLKLGDIEKVPVDWRTSIPFGSKDDKTIQEIIGD